MEKLDRLGWAAGIAFTAYGLRIGVRVNDPAVLDRVVDVLPPGWKPATTPVVDHLYSLIAGGSTARSHVRRFNVLYASSSLLARSMDLANVSPILERNLHQYVASYARRRVFVHAGVVGWKGRAIVLPGAGFAGKSTLVTALLRAGASYYSDEYAVFDRQGRVHPFTRRLGLRRDNEHQQEHYSIEELGGRAGRKPLPVGLVAITRYREAAHLRPRVLSPGPAVLALMEHAIDPRWQPEAALQTLGQVVRGAEVIKGVRGDAEDTAELLLRRLSVFTNSE